MGFIKAFSGALGGSFANQWKDYFTVPNNLPATVGMCSATRVNLDSRRSSNTNSIDTLISNGSMIFVPEGFALITFENGAVTGYITEPGGYTWVSEDPNSQSIFAGDALSSDIFRQTWERFKFGGGAFADQIALYVNLKEIPNNRFGTQSTIYWDDSFFNSQVGATAHGTYTLKIINPILFVRGFLPAKYYMEPGHQLDFDDFDNPINRQLASEVIGSLAAALSLYTNTEEAKNRISNIQSDSLGFAQSLKQILEQGYHWFEERGITIHSATILAIDYDEGTKELLSKVQQADALMGSRGNSNLQASLADGLRAAGENPEGGAIGIGLMGMAAQYAGSVANGVQQPVNANQSPNSDTGLYGQIADLKRLFDEGMITQEEFDSAKKKALGL